MVNSNYDRLVGEGKIGLGKQELKKRVKQHNALANKLISSAQDKPLPLSAQDTANIYRGYKLQQDANTMESLGKKPISYLGGNTKTTGPTTPGVSSTVNKDTIKKAWDMTVQGYKDTAKKWAGNIKKIYTAIDAINYGLLPGAAKPVNPFGENRGSSVDRYNKAINKNNAVNIPVWDDRNKKNKNTKLG